MNQTPSDPRESIRANYLRDEGEAVAELLAIARLDPAAEARVASRARELVETVRAKQKASAGMQSFLQEYDLSSREGVLLMCVAEALLRIPDAATADALIRDKFSQGEWDSHFGKSTSLLVNAGTWGMMLTGRIVSVDDAPAGIGNWVASLAARAGEPVVRLALRQAMKLMAEQFVMGRTIEDALARAATADHAAYRHSYDMLGEAAFTAEDAERYFVAYERAIDAIAASAAQRNAGAHVFAKPGISIKLSALHPRYEHAQRERVMAELTPRIAALAERARKGDIGVTLDAEEADRLDLSLDIFERVFASEALAGWEGFGLAVQAYQKRAPFVIDALAAVARKGGRRIMVRLVKGAYWDSEVKRGQAAGLSEYPVYTRKCNTDVSYLACAARMLAAPDAFYGQFATHNAHTVATILERAKEGQAFEFQRLHGMGDELYSEVTGALGHACRVYAPVGSHEDLLPYLVRRLLENGANTSFVNRIADSAVPVESVIADPVVVASANADKRNPRIPLPANLYGDRRNSGGFVFADEATSAPFLAALEPLLARTDWTAAPLVKGRAWPGTKVEIRDPSNGRAVGSVMEAETKLVDQAFSAAVAATMPDAQARATILEAAADKLEAKRVELIALLAREAGKTLPDALGEVREAADFCRYYALLARRHFAAPETLAGPTGESNDLRLAGRGPFVCISPWNFPLAIFVGQVAAAFAAGNPVIAKPAEQTPLIAFQAIRILLEAGVPPDALALLPGRGETLGAMLVADPRTAGVAFTGSTGTARAINRALAAREGPIVPFIAETGGLNAMLVDSSALPEQVVADVIASSFNSAGQRCSALRVLCLQKEIAPRVLSLLEGATKELVLGDPARLATDVGPVIDAESLSMLLSHSTQLDRTAKLVCRAKMPAGEGGNFFAPCAYELPSLDAIDKEVFGPILHVVTFASGELEPMLAAINAKGYGLTLGVHSRIEETVEFIRRRACVGNLYVNRNMIGATVGVQPFGGEGLSGTGPKAGGPHYLFRFAVERTFTVNTAAAGGNATLIANAE
ncbi:bifunctional proline dehydrogenase/L-glutamate gamma-semialdehyde dehydrogenase PutA [Usitatibacter palustris]|uniref:Bifunctional protein PutA n=1 Tax=Usitatibacter palustris TaxID=2732487 RepID=A0A6M4H953_9PROT|nr:bifunctional proline dehydrogenase/L-glutamate gamma-semialdehyde dehydrogenase PutA [Usitatibacter palustris]QJR16111.1 Bifunctional protein PutA [Usitatibacter palustris]